MQRFVLAVLLMEALSFSRSARADETPAATKAPAAAPADPLSIYVMTFGPGDHPFFKFGHDALLVRDRAAGTERVYNFGTFRFDSPGLIVDFLHGRLTYWLSVSGLAPTVASYERENRTIVLQELALSPEAKAAMRAALDENARPETATTSTTTSSTTARRACATPSIARRAARCGHRRARRGASRCAARRCA